MCLPNSALGTFLLSASESLLGGKHIRMKKLAHSELEGPGKWERYSREGAVRGSSSIWHNYFEILCSEYKLALTLFLGDVIYKKSYQL